MKVGPSSLIQQYCQNNRLQITGVRLGPAGGATTTGCANSSDILNLALGYGAAGSNNGNLVSQGMVTNDPLNVSQSYTYDAYNRVLTAGEGSGWSQTYGYDQFGNRWVSADTGYPLVDVHADDLDGVQRE